MDPIRQFRELWDKGERAEALSLARQAIPALPPAAAGRFGAVLRKALPEFFTGENELVEVFLAGQVATQFFPPLITALAWAEGVPVSVTEGGYDQAIQDISALTPKSSRIVIFVPWHERLTARDGRAFDARVNDELSYVAQVWSAAARAESTLIQVGWDAPGPSVLGYCLDGKESTGHLSAIRELNRAVRKDLPGGAFFLDLDEISSWHGKAGFFDQRNNYWVHQPFSQTGLHEFSRHLAAAIRSLTKARRKVLVLDLDNTLWGGVVGETGPLGVQVGDGTEGLPFLAFQKEISRLKDSGIVLAVASKNNPEDAREPFEKNEQMHLKLGDIASFHASWNRKSDEIRQIARELNLGLDSFVFFDDNPAERAEVGSVLPMVKVVDVPEDPALFPQALRESLAFETGAIGAADAQRAEQYQAEAGRRSVLESCQSPEDYLRSLEMEAEILGIDETNLERVSALITKTNQFNLTTRRHSRPAIENFVAAEGNISFAVKLNDKFGDYGIISVILAGRDGGEALKIDTWLMSCRAMSRTVEHFVMNAIAARASAAGYRKLIGEYLPTQKNKPVSELLPGFGFSPANGDAGLLELALEGFEPAATWVNETLSPD